MTGGEVREELNGCRNLLTTAIRIYGEPGFEEHVQEAATRLQELLRHIRAEQAAVNAAGAAGAIEALDRIGGGR
jgi:hypothetical protein